MFTPERTASAKVLKLGMLGMFKDSRAVRGAGCWEAEKPRTEDIKSRP